MSKKLLYIINHIDWFWSHRLPLAQSAQAKGFDVHLAVTGAHKDERLKTHDFRGHNLPASDEGFLPLTIMKTILSIHKIIKTQRPEIVHAITLKYAFITGLAALPVRNIRMIHTIAGLGYLFAGEGLKPKILRALVGPFLKLALKNKRTKLIFQNPDDKALMIKRGFANAENCYLIKGSGVDMTQFQAQPNPDTQSDSPVILMPTRLVLEKGIRVFIKTAKIVHAQKPNIKFHIAGGVTTNNPNAITHNQMKRFLEGSPVEWLGKVTDMPALYNKATLICYPSYYGEGIPKVLLEACAAARPIITTDHPGCREAVENGVNGLLVPVKDPATTANAILQLLHDKEKLEKMGQAGRKLAEKEFDVHIINEKTTELYQ